MDATLCPFCRKEIQAGVDICGWCETNLATGLIHGPGAAGSLSSEQVVQFYNSVESWRTSALPDPLDPARPFRWHWPLPVLAIGILVFFRSVYPDVILGIPILLGSLLFVIFAIQVIKGPRWISPSKCADPRRAMELFLSSVGGINTAGNAY